MNIIRLFFVSGELLTFCLYDIRVFSWCVLHLLAFISAGRSWLSADMIRLERLWVSFWIAHYYHPPLYLLGCLSDSFIMRAIPANAILPSRYDGGLCGPQVFPSLVYHLIADACSPKSNQPETFFSFCSSSFTIRYKYCPPLACPLSREFIALFWK